MLYDESMKSLNDEYILRFDFIFLLDGRRYPDADLPPNNLQAPITESGRNGSHQLNRANFYRSLALRDQMEYESKVTCAPLAG